MAEYRQRMIFRIKPFAKVPYLLSKTMLWVFDQICNVNPAGFRQTPQKACSHERRKRRNHNHNPKRSRKSVAIKCESIRRKHYVSLASMFVRGLF